jgi:asparagine synthetase B (glutamine-hydrolysing)
MCGICGFILKELMEPVEITKAIERMIQTLRHRGPDGHSPLLCLMCGGGGILKLNKDLVSL